MIKIYECISGTVFVHRVYVCCCVRTSCACVVCHSTSRFQMKAITLKAPSFEINKTTPSRSLPTLRWYSISHDANMHQALQFIDIILSRYPNAHAVSFSHSPFSLLCLSLALSSVSTVTTRASPCTHAYTLPKTSPGENSTKEKTSLAQAKKHFVFALVFFFTILRTQFSVQTILKQCLSSPHYAVPN